MKTSRLIATMGCGLWLGWSSAMLVALVPGASITLSAQSPPPAQGTIVVTTVDGVEHVYHFTKDLLVHGGKGNGVDALEGLREGSAVVVHYTAKGAEQSAIEADRVGDEGLKVIRRVTRSPISSRRRPERTI